MTTLVDAPTRVDGVQLIGEMVGSGYRTPPALVRRSDGQVLQLTPLLYLVLKAADGRRSCADIAELIGRELGRSVTETDVRTLVDGHLRPLGLVKGVDGSEPELKRSNPLLALKPQVAITNPRTTHLLTDPFRVLFRPVVAAAVLLAFVAVVAWVFFDRGLGASAYDAFERPHLLLLVFVVSVLSGGFHEFGHAAAARYSGAEAGVMGAGLYLVWPAFYTDVTDSYRLGRAGRIRTDLGGLYFNAIVVVLTFVWWWATGWEALLLLVATQVLQMVQQLLPLLRFDGYHLLADLAGVPDLYHRIRPTLTGLLPHRWNAPENRLLTPTARALITLWVLVTVPMMALMLMALVAAVPRLLGSAGSAIRTDAAATADGWRAGSVFDVAAHALQVLGVVLPLVACVMILGRIGVRWFRGLARWSHGSPVKRVVAAVLSAMLVTALAWAWWPHPGSYRPIQPGEQGLVTTLLPGSQAALAGDRARPPAEMLADSGALPVGTAATDRLAGDRPLVAMFQEGTELPTRDDPVLAMVLVPTDGAAADDTSSFDPDRGVTATDPSADGVPDATTDGIPEASTDGIPDPTTDGIPDPTTDGSADPSTDASSPEPVDTWVFPFDQPLPPAEGDNQALAVATTDGSVTYDLAFALVWAEDDQVLNVNEAHAYASCRDCVAVAVAYQVVLIMDDAQVVVPQNLAVAANYDCYRCITAAIASQLVLSVQEEPGEEELRALAEVWDRLIEFAQLITSYSLTEITAQLDSFSAQIVAILWEAPPVEPSPSATTSPTPSDGVSDSSPSPTGTTSPSPTPGSTTTPDPTSSGTTTSDPTTSDATTSDPTTSDPTTSDPTPSESSTPTSEPTASSSGTPTTSPSPTETSTSTTTTSPSPSETSSTATSPSPTASP
ncbi:hypothetical protein DDE18_17340 [Nocardioides gansuensis]|uniref:Peptide zinc metalloprotease protein n=1 Tax=Nocardioides gansuensis TaxID=2138300 RepID=A0A2T8F7P6_9ACTN|nr:hypothetical protein [Nocardioides gansuensis]PVG81738.1 hypothetical protein DDE18_17340 [Nocardioides gansuensis]